MAEEGTGESGNNEAAAAKTTAGSQKNPLVAVLLILNLIAMGTVAFFQYKR
jgi:hypothetical protein